MKKPLAFVAVLGAALSVSLRGTADAPLDQYDPFMKGDTSITDAWTHLVWTRSSSNLLTSDTLVDQYCLSPARLPTIKELLTIVDEEPNARYDSIVQHTVNFYVDPEVFPDIIGKEDAPYCTQTRDVMTGLRYGVDFKTGISAVVNIASGCHVRCVQYVGP